MTSGSVTPARPPLGPRAAAAYAVIRQRILTGSLPEGSRLPSQTHLAAELRVAVMTLRQALQQLEAEGLVSSEHGRGTFVRSTRGEFRRSADRLAAVVSIQHEIAEAMPNMQSMVEIVTRRSQELLGGTSALVGFLEGDEIVYRGVSGRALPHAGLRVGLHHSLSGLAVRTGEPQRSDNTLEDSRVDLGAVEPLVAGSMVTVPVRDVDRVIGVLAVLAGLPHSFDDDDVHTLELVAGLLGTAIARVAEGAAKQELLAERGRAQGALAASEERYRELFENANDIVFTVDLSGKFASINRAAEQISGYSREEAAAMSIEQVIAPEYVPLARQMIGEKLAGRTSTMYEIELLTRDGRRVPLEISTHLLFQEGHPVGIQGIGRDISARRRKEESLRHQALYDSLTGLPNRILLLDRLHGAIGLARAEKSSAALLLLDLDRFKEVNDTFGHLTGDIVLEKLGERLQEALRESDTVARLGGDEFAIILPNTDMLGSLWTTAKLLRVLARPWTVEGHEIQLGGSIGIAIYPEHGSDDQTLLQHADFAMYAAKRGGIGYALYSTDPGDHAPDQAAAEAELRRALEERQLVLHYQPKVDLRTNAVEAVEALIRWQHPERGLVEASEFIPLAERTGLIQPITRWVFQQALLQCKTWREAGVDLCVAVNLSARNLRDEHLVDVVEHQLEACGLEPSSLRVEVSEANIIREPETALAILLRFRERGISVSIDDFGSAYSTVAQFQQLVADEIKLDGSFIRNITQDDADASMVRSVIALAHDLDLEVVAEGPEDQSAVDMLTGMGCDLAQCYHLGSPLPARDLTTWLKTRSFRGSSSYEASA